MHESADQRRDRAQLMNPSTPPLTKQAARLTLTANNTPRPGHECHRRQARDPPILRLGWRFHLAGRIGLTTPGCGSRALCSRRLLLGRPSGRHGRSRGALPLPRHIEGDQHCKAIQAHYRGTRSAARRAACDLPHARQRTGQLSRRAGGARAGERTRPPRHTPARSRHVAPLMPHTFFCDCSHLDPPS